MREVVTVVNLRINAGDVAPFGGCASEDKKRVFVCLAMKILIPPLKDKVIP